jgi:hypothetical protein
VKNTHSNNIKIITEKSAKTVAKSNTAYYNIAALYPQIKIGLSGKAPFVFGRFALDQ